MLVVVGSTEVPGAALLAKLSSATRREVEVTPIAYARRIASALNVVAVLKGTVSIIAHPSGELWRYSGRTMGLATCGSGDVLAGAIAGLLARGAPPAQAAVWGVALHGLSGAMWPRRFGDVGFLAREIAAEFPSILHVRAESGPREQICGERWRGHKKHRHRNDACDGQ